VQAAASVSDGLNGAGGQGVAGSNPVSPTSWCLRTSRATGHPVSSTRGPGRQG